MSYDIDLNDPKTGEPCKLDVPHQMKGGTYQVGGCPEASLNITYNYAPIYTECFGEKGIRFLYGKNAADTIPILEEAIDALGDDVNPDYWAATEGNAKAALRQLVALAKMRPDGVWAGD